MVDSSKTLDLSYLRLPSSLIETITHSPEYIQGIGKDKKPFRKIFGQQKFTAQELNALKGLNTLVDSNRVKLPSHWVRESELMKFVYTGKFEPEKSYEALMKNLEWRNNQSDLISAAAQRMLNDGIFYQYGRDKKYRPVIIINIHAINPKINSEETTIEALCYFLKHIQANMFAPSKIENWIIILETNKMSFFKFPIGILKMIITTLSVNFNASLEHLFILNPSTSFNMVWGGASSFIDSAQKEKISFISSKKDMVKITNHIDGSQLEKKYGGQLADVSVNFWPPQNTIMIKPEAIKEVPQQIQPQPENKTEGLKEASKELDQRISVMKGRSMQNIPPIVRYRTDNPLEDQLQVYQVANQVPANANNYNTNTNAFARPSNSRSQLNNSQTGGNNNNSNAVGFNRPSNSRSQLNRVSNLDRVSIITGYSRPSHANVRSVYRSCNNSFTDFESSRLGGAGAGFDDGQTDRDVFYSFNTCFQDADADGGVDDLKVWQRWNGNGVNPNIANNGGIQILEEIAAEDARESLRFTQMQHSPPSKNANNHNGSQNNNYIVHTDSTNHSSQNQKLQSTELKRESSTQGNFQNQTSSDMLQQQQLQQQSTEQDSKERESGGYSNYFGSEIKAKNKFSKDKPTEKGKKGFLCC